MRYDPCMTNPTTSQIAALKIQNARNKRRIQAKRAINAKTIATAHTISHPGKFPTNYKYG